jgi:hypothetical protein
MKLIIRKYAIFALAAVIALMASCTKEYPEVTYNPSVETTEVLNLRPDSVTITGFIPAGNEEFTEKGICYNTTGDPTIDDTKIIYEGSNDGATFQITITGLNYTTTYFARAYGIHSTGVLYGSDTTFTTPAAVPTVTTALVTGETNVSATSGGSIVDWGGADVTAKGVCYSMHGTPTVDSLKTEDGDGLADFVSEMSGLYGGKIYYVRAYATNSSGTGYGAVLEFTTQPVTVPEVTTDSVPVVGLTTAIAYGNVNSTGGDDVTARGLCWGTSSNPVIETDSVSIIGDGVGEFSDTIQNLEEGTDYYIRAYATNSEGTAYGAEIMITTQTATFAPERIYIISGGTSLGSIVPIPEVEFQYQWEEGDYEGYVWLPAGSLSFTMSDMETGGQVLGDDGADGILDFDGAEITVAEEGFYKIKMNVLSFEYSTAFVNWGVIGDATPGGWDNSTDMTYMGDETWEVTVFLTADNWKVRANNEWVDGLVYGDYDPIDGILDDLPGGGNIPVDTEGTYKIVIDLSEFPYTYTIEEVVK